MGNLFPTPIPKTDPPSLRKPLRLLLLRLLGLAFNTPAQPHPVNRRVLLIRPDHLGDLLFVTPALRTLRAQMPDAHVTLLVGPWGKPVVERSPYVDEVQTLAFPGFTRRPKGSPLAPYTRLWEA
ncbi:MAG: hypothetical protein HYR71_03030, partial [Chloroflexi bacterium]|nr:hypothetical protein [Chloroflexota bacterium]